MNNSPKQPYLALTLSLLYPGIGQIYAGSHRTGIAFITLSTLLAIASLLAIVFKYPKAGMLMLLLLPVVYVASVIHAYLCARRANTPEYNAELKATRDPWLAVILSKFLPGLGHFYVKKYLLGAGILVVFLVLAGVQEALTESLLVFPAAFLVILFSAFACYHAYMSAVVRREETRKIIIIICVIYVLGPLFSFGAAMALREYVVQAYYFPTGSMENTLVIGDHILVEKLSVNGFLTGDAPRVRRGDIVVYPSPDNTKKDFLKRCVAVEGDRFSIRDSRVHINGSPIYEPYALGPTDYHGFTEKKIEGVVPKGMIVVLGDNRTNSFDSRGHGYVPVAAVKGKAYLLYFNKSFLSRGLSRFGYLQ